MKLRSIQVIRGIAAVAVALMHARYFSGQHMGDSITRLGAAGVDLFFVVSGFIMASISKPSATRFLFDRFWRVVPMWLVAAVPWVLLQSHSLPVLLSTFTLWPIYGKFVLPALPLGWSLSFEVLFYAAVATAMVTRPIVPLVAFGVALIAGIVTGAPLFDFIGNPMIFEFLFGVTISRLPCDARVGPVLILMAIVCLGLGPMAMYPAEVATDAHVSGYRVIFWGVPAAMLVYGALSAEPIFAHRFFTPFVRLGDASYSIYLSHLGIVIFAGFAWGVNFVLALICGFIVWQVIERPLLCFKPEVGRHVEGMRPGGRVIRLGEEGL